MEAPYVNMADQRVVAVIVMAASSVNMTNCAPHAFSVAVVLYVNTNE